MKLQGKPRKFVDGLSQRARKVKLQAEVHLIDRELESLKASFGVKLYDAISQNDEIPPMLASMTEFYKACNGTIQNKVDQQDSKYTEIDAHQSQRLRAPQPTNLKERARWLGTNLTTRSADTKLKLQALWLEREVKLAKEAFGQIVFPLALEFAKPEVDGPPQPEAAPDAAFLIQRIIDETAQAASEPMKRKEEKVALIDSIESSNQVDENKPITIQQ